MSDDSAPTPAAPPGWYPDPKMVDTKRYWDGQAWTDHAAPAQSASVMVPIQQERQGISAVKGIVIVALGILVAVGVIAVIVKSSKPSAYDCVVQQSEVDSGDRNEWDLDSDCR